LGTAPAEIEHFLGDGHPDLGLVERIVLDAERAARGIAQTARADGALEIDRWEIEALGLPKLELDGLAVLDRLADLGVVMERGVHGFLERQRMAGRSRPRREERDRTDRRAKEISEIHDPPIHFGSLPLGPPPDPFPKRIIR